MKTNRNIIVVILLTIITFGIYPLFFWHGYIRDVNKVCAGDGKNTSGLLVLILLSIVTFGIYGIVWTYNVQNRLRDNANRYNAGMIKGGGTVLCWMIFGSFLFGIGSLIALYIEIESLNRLCYGYNAMQNNQIAHY